MAPVPESKREHEKEQVMLTVTKTVLQAELAAKRWVNCRPTWSAKRGRRCRRTWTRWPTKWPIRRRGCYCSCTKTIRPFTVGSKTPPAPPIPQLGRTDDGRRGPPADARRVPAAHQRPRRHALQHGGAVAAKFPFHQISHFSRKRFRNCLRTKWLILVLE